MHLTVLERQALTDAAAEGFDEIEATLQRLQLVERLLRQHVRPHRHHLAQLDVGRAALLRDP